MVTVSQKPVADEVRKNNNKNINKRKLKPNKNIIINRTKQTTQQLNFALTNWG